MQKANMNLQYSNEDMGLDEDEFAQLIRLFIETSTVDLREAVMAAGFGDSQRIYERMHSIKGAAECLGLYEVSELARKNEMIARKNSIEGTVESLDLIVKNLGLISDSLESILRSFTKYSR